MEDEILEVECSSSFCALLGCLCRRTLICADAGMDVRFIIWCTTIIYEAGYSVDRAVLLDHLPGASMPIYASGQLAMLTRCLI